MILYKKKKTKTKKQKQTMAKESTLGVPRGEKEGSGMDGHFGGVLDANWYIWNGWAVGLYCRAQGNVCDWVTWLHNRT